MKKGDIFILHILGKNLAYKVDQIRTVLPEETGELDIVEGEDHVTLVTCTPYGVNTHRLLVRGIRTKYVEGEIRNDETISQRLAATDPKKVLARRLCSTYCSDPADLSECSLQGQKTQIKAAFRKEGGGREQ